MNQIFISGNVTLVKEVATVKNSKVLNFSVAVNKFFTKDGEKQSETQYVECAIWNRENIYPFIKKGSHVVIQGEASATAYINKEQKAIAVLNCKVDSIEFHNKKETEE